jgi:hypothetical protein
MRGFHSALLYKISALSLLKAFCARPRDSAQSRCSMCRAAFLTRCSGSVPAWLAISESCDSGSGLKMNFQGRSLADGTVLSRLMCLRRTGKSLRRGREGLQSCKGEL